MKILFINRLMGIRQGGGEYFDYYVAKEYKRVGNEVVFIIGKKKNSTFLMDDFETFYITTPYLRDINYKYAESRLRLLRKLAGLCLDFDLYIFEKNVLRYLNTLFTYFTPDIVELCGLPRLGFWIEKKFKIPTIIEWHGEPSRNWIKYAKKCSGHIAVGAAFKKVKEIISENTLQVYPGVDYEFFTRKENKIIRTSLGIPKEAIVFIFVGRLIPVKNLNFMINSFQESLKVNKNLYLLIVGDGPERNALQKNIIDRNLQSNIKLTGWINREEIVDYYSASDIFIITSNYESFSLVTLEAMSCELPIIATNVGFLPEIVKHGTNGFIVENNNIVQLKETILKIASEPELRIKMGKVNRQKVIDNYSWHETAKKMLDYCKILNNLG